MDGVPKLTANELRRQRDRERYASLSVEEKAALVQKNRENRNRKNSATTSGTGVLGDITNLSAVERRRKRARDKYASMSPEEKERLLQKNRVQGHQAMLTPWRQPFTDLTNQAFNEADADSAGDCVLPISCITQLKQGGSLLVGNVDLMEGEAIVDDDDDDDDESYLMRGRDIEFESYQTSAMPIDASTRLDDLDKQYFIVNLDDDDLSRTENHHQGIVDF
uniref:Uncharacterized protein n=1 Tax=Oryza punctata TaxID=4537 RepID=A0A0E0KG49_ORYPU